jgi:hypothetical protein
MQSAIPERPSTDHAWRRISALVGLSLEARLLLAVPILSRSFATTAALQATSWTRSDVILMGNAHGCRHTGAFVVHLVARRSTPGSKFDSEVTPEPQREAARLRADGRNERASSCRSSKTGRLAKGNRQARTIGWMLVRGAFARLPRPRTEGASVCRNRRHGKV